MFNIKRLFSRRQPGPEAIQLSKGDAIDQTLNVPERHAFFMGAVKDLAKENNELLRALTLAVNEVNMKSDTILNRQDETAQDVRAIRDNITPNTKLTAEPTKTIGQARELMDALAERDRAIYLYVLGKGTAKASEVQAEFKELSRTTIYRIVRGLIARGLIAETGKGTYKPGRKAKHGE